MKTMTCRQMGGPCDTPIHGNTADELIKNGDAHLTAMVAQGDESHKEAAKMMADMKQNPASGMEWYEKMKRDFEALPED